MLSTSFQITPYAAMARPVAGVRGETLVIAVPGSPKAAKENVQAVIKLLPHACDLACGGNSRAMHAERNIAETGKGVMNDQERVNQHSHHLGMDMDMVESNHVPQKNSVRYCQINLMGKVNFNLEVAN